MVATSERIQATKQHVYEPSNLDKKIKCIKNDPDNKSSNSILPNDLWMMTPKTFWTVNTMKYQNILWI